MGFEYMYNIKERSWDEDHLKTSSSVLSPKNHTVRLWYLFIALTSLSAFSVQVFQVFFNANLYALSTVRYGHDLIYFLYIISCFYIGYEENGVVITDIKQVRSRYLHTWFIVDLCSLIPLELLVISLPALFFLNLNRCLRVLTLFKIIASFAKEPDTNKIHVTALNSFCIMIICIQSCACIWYYNVCTSTHGSVERSCPSTFNWLQLLPDVSTNLTGISDMTLYADALYWAAITLSAVGYGDIYATNSSEVKIACFVMVIGYLAFGVIMTGMSSIISNLDAQRGRFYNRMDAIRIHMRHMGLPQELQTWVHKYYYYLWLHRKGNAIAGLWDDLPYTLRSEIATACYKPMLKKGSIFDDGDDGFIRALHDKFSTSTYSPGQVLAKPGEVNQNAYYIDNGLVQVIGDDEEKIATLLPGSFIGEVRDFSHCTSGYVSCALSVVKLHTPSVKFRTDSVVA